MLPGCPCHAASLFLLLVTFRTKYVVVGDVHRLTTGTSYSGTTKDSTPVFVVVFIYRCRQRQAWVDAFQATARQTFVLIYAVIESICSPSLSLSLFLSCIASPLLCQRLAVDYTHTSMFEILSSTEMIMTAILLSLHTAGNWS